MLAQCGRIDLKIKVLFVGTNKRLTTFAYEGSKVICNRSYSHAQTKLLRQLHRSPEDQREA